MDHLLDVSSCEDLFAVHLTFLTRLQNDLVAFVEGWNHHPLRTEGNRTAEQLWQTGIVLQLVNQPENLEDIQEPDIDWDLAADFGEDVHGVVVVPEFDCPITEDQLVECQNLINDNQDLDSRSLCLLCREYLATLNA
ncbi:hypothetical protein CRENBAI_021996 [Crenichthys baileyi]|uniref:Integrase core domain-containing protein n=1 Tax=Crenichthys baileyi TaxID=28760 RepID=A0AAV9S446_9TELE